MPRALFFFLLLPALCPAQTADERKATVAYLLSFESADGGFRAAPAGAPSLRATSGGLRALKYFSGKPAHLDAARRFVLSCRDAESGGFADSPGGQPDVIVTAVGLMALVELKIPTDKYASSAVAFMAGNAKEFEQIRMTAAGLEAIGQSCHKNKSWLADLTAKQNPDGTFGKGASRSRDTGGTVACILRLGGKVEAGPILQALDAGQRDDGGFAKDEGDVSDLETTYRVMRTYWMLKAKPKRADALRQFVANCRNSDGGYGVAPGSPSSLPATYFAGIVLYWLDQK